jgi:phage shock protein A
MKITELAQAMTGMPMGDDPVKAIDDAIKQKTEQMQALQKEIADLKQSKPQAQAAVQQQKAQQATQGTQGTQQQPQGGTTAPAMNTTIQATPVQPS